MNNATIRNTEKYITQSFRSFAICICGCETESCVTEGTIEN